MRSRHSCPLACGAKPAGKSVRSTKSTLSSAIQLNMRFCTAAFSLFLLCSFIRAQDSPAHSSEPNSVTVPMTIDHNRVVINADWEKGQLSSIQAALRSLPAGLDGMLLCLVDHPLISANLVGELIATFYSSNAPIVLPLFEGRRGHPVIFSAKLFPELQAAPLEIGARAVVWAHRSEICQFPTNEEGCVLNLNDPETFARVTRSTE